jgi:hypothetical protein
MLDRPDCTFFYLEKSMTNDEGKDKPSKSKAFMNCLDFLKSGDWRHAKIIGMI